MSRPIRARIDLAALRHNLAIARRHAGGSRIWCVVKANAYGHGLRRVAAALADAADGFAVVELAEARVLRQAGLNHPILMLEGCYTAADLAEFAAHGLTPVLHRVEQAAWLAESGLTLPVYLKLNTGMNRLGLDANGLMNALSLLDRRGYGGEVTLMTHFADADEERGIAEQLERLRAMCTGLAYPLCLANSAALLRFPESRGDWVRPGIMLYGSSPFAGRQTAAELGLQPAMTLESEIIAVRELAAGDHVGYGSTFTAPAAMRIGIVACGYADGYPRHAPSGTPALVAGVRSGTVGRVSMDKLSVDITHIPQAAVGTPVTLWGRGLPADEVAAAAGTISYEMFCALAPRVPVIEEDSGEG